jgi:hypothetical protein
MVWHRNLLDDIPGTGHRHRAVTSR